MSIKVFNAVVASNVRQIRGFPEIMMTSVTTESDEDQQRLERPRRPRFDLFRMADNFIDEITAHDRELAKAELRPH